MKVIQGDCPRSLSYIFAVLVVADACGDASGNQRSLIRADAEVFESVVRSELSRAVPDPAAPPGFLRVDSRPAGDNMSLAGPGKRSPGFDLDESGDTLSAAPVARVVEQRRGVLEFLNVEEGGPFVYPGCGGTRTSRLKSSATVSVHPNCPVVWRRYVTVGLPYRGTAAVLNKLRSDASPPPDSSGEAWTVLVTESSVGPGGQDYRQFAWVFRRDPENHRLAVAEKFLLSWAE